MIFVLTFPVLPRCSYGFRNEGPRWTHGSSRFYPGFIPVHAGQPRFYYVNARCCPGCPRRCPGDCRSRYGMRRWRHGSTPVRHGSSRFTPVCRTVNYLISQCCYDGFIHMKTKLYTVHVRAYELACWYFGNRGNT